MADNNGFIERNGFRFGVASNRADNVLMNSATLGNTKTVQEILEGVFKAGASSILDLVYPVGSIYMSTVNTSPASIMGGTWTRIQDRFLLAAGSTYTAATTGGAATVTLDSTMIPSHLHGVSITSGSVDINHYHSGTSSTVDINHYHTGTADANGDHNHTLNIQANVCVSGGSVDRVALTGITNTWSGAINSAGSHQHTFTTGYMSSNNTHAHTLTTGYMSANNTHTHSVSGNTGNTGGGLAHENMPPYIVVYVWYRSA